MKRKIIQIAAGEGGDLFALCDDGTVWLCTYEVENGIQISEEKRWERLPDIPQEKEGET